MNRRLALFVFGILMCAAIAVPVAGMQALHTTSATTVRYEPSTANLANPERGFYHHEETHYRADGSGYTPLDQAELEGFRTNEQITLILRIFYLEKFSTTDTLDAAYLDLVADDFATLRASGLKAVVRFVYAQPADEWPYQPPYNDAPVERVRAHVAQLTPILRANADVIATVQAGFVGLWGEWYYTDHYVTDPADPTSIGEQDWANRKGVVDALLEALPLTRTVQLRTPKFKRTLYGTEALTSTEAFSGDARARIGHHNDCFLAPFEDYGTYEDPTVERPYLAADSQYVPVGGETCAPNPPRTDCAGAMAEMEQFHWSYLNADYNRDVIDPWGTADPPCLDTIRQRLGYRLMLKEATFADGATPGGTIPLRIVVQNEGWAAPYNQRAVELVLRSNTGTVRRIALQADPRRWGAGEESIIEQNVVLPDDLPAGRYEMLLNLPDPVPSLRDTPAYSIQLANVGTWEAATGFNNLNHTLEITPTTVYLPLVWR